MRIIPINHVAYTRNHVSTLPHRESFSISKSQNSQQNVNFKGQWIRTATSILTGAAGAAIGFCVAGPPGAVAGAIIGGGGGAIMESEDSKSSTGDNNFFDKRD